MHLSSTHKAQRDNSRDQSIYIYTVIYGKLRLIQMISIRNTVVILADSS